METNNSKESERLRVLVSGGGTGGHIFPALSIANEVKRRMPEAEILFVGALDRENGLDLLDFAARQYDPATGRFTTVDPKAHTAATPQVPLFYDKISTG